MGVNRKERKKVHIKEVRKAAYPALLLLLCFLFPNEEIKAQASPERGNGRHPLIQSTNVAEEYKALVRLGFFNTGEWSKPVKGSDAETKQEEGEKPEYKTEAQMLFAALAKETAYEKARAATVQINMGTHYGSGILWDIREENLVIVSNSHLLQEAQSGEVVFRNGVSVQGTVTGLSDTKDIGFMETPLSILEREDWLTLRFADKNLKNYEELSAGDGLFVVGSSNGAGNDYYEGTLGDTDYYFPEFQSDMLYGYCKALPGMSGGGTFDRQGHFIGMLTAGTKEGEIASIPVGTVAEEYDMIYENME